ncbi:sulfite exporter TauE/SafE family protein [Bradyrhizobium sp. NBAIM08]|uniref:sulfite exporter TauE/SafE family protein n=1 Tax=Bradyrhizobium sp. NBAIM08 TaxID=2793815 RepID=UPI0034D2C7D7
MEVFVNVYVLLINLKGVRVVWRRVFPILLGLLPGVALGGYALTSLQPGWIKFATYTIILPLILLQAAGWRRPIGASWLIGLPFGWMLGVLYSLTTISGPPIAMLFNNQGLVKHEFRAGLALVRVVESSVTAFVYYQLGLFIYESGSLLYVFVPSVLLGVPLGSYVIRRLDAEIFRRICMSFDAWIVGFGLSRVLIELDLVQSAWAYSVMAAAILIDLSLLYLFFTTHNPNLISANCGYKHLNDAGGQLGIECARVLDLIDAALFGGDDDGLQIWLIAPDGPAHRRREPGITGQP